MSNRTERRKKRPYRLSDLIARLFGCLIVPLCLAGCDRGGASRDPLPASVPVFVTNVVEVTQTVTVTNVVEVTVTNVVETGEAPILSARRTAPYVVSSATLDEARLRQLLSESGARVIECSVGAVALVEATEKSVGVLRPLTSIKPLEPQEKIASDAGERVCVTPVSSIDVAAVVKAVRGLGGEVMQVMTVGHPRIRARLSYSAIRKLAVRGDVRRIERDEK